MGNTPCEITGLFWSGISHALQSCDLQSQGGVKIRLDVEHPGDSGMETLAIVDMDRCARMGELLETAGGMFQVIQVVHTPFDAEQDAVLIVRRRG